MDNADQQSIESWLSELKASYPHLPDHLSLDVEKRCLEQLEGWFRRVQRLRLFYDQMDRDDVPDELTDEGKRQVVPVLMSLESMTDEEANAWHELFVCLSAMLAKIAYRYYKAHLQGRSSPITLIDALNYLPVVFLYVLSSYDATRGASGDTSFQGESDRIRLSTWVYRDARRHINSYMQQHAYTVRRGSGTVHRLKAKLRRTQHELYKKHGHQPSRRQVLEFLSDKEGEEITLDSESYNRILKDDTLSLNKPATEDESATYEDMLESSAGDVEDRYDPVRLAVSLARGNEKVEEALEKLFDTDKPLSMKERYALGV